jgi:phosphonate transport system substrate-binding protein
VRIVSYLAPNWFWFYEAIAAYLNRELAIDTQITQSQFDPLDDPTLLHQQFDLAWICGLPLIRYCRSVAERLQVVAAPVMQAVRYQDRPVYFSDVIARSNCELSAFKDLLGKTLGYNDRGSNSGYYLLFHYLLEQGYSSKFFGNAIASGSHQQSIRCVLQGLVDCAAIDSTVLERELLNYPELKMQLQIITSIGPCPMPPLVAAHHLSQEWIEEIQFALLEPDAELQTAMYKAGVQRFAIVQLAEYEVIGQLYDAVSQANYGVQYAT